MRYLLSWLNPIGLIVAVVVVTMVGCSRPSIVNKSTCTVSWDAVADQREIEYRVTTWPNVGTAASNKVVYRVPRGKTETTCNDVGARTAGPWMVSVQACTEKNICSDPAGPVAFTIVDR